MGCSAVKAEIAKCPEHVPGALGPAPGPPFSRSSSWEITESIELHQAAQGFPPTRRTHERHLHAMERFRAKVERSPHRFTDLVERYRAVLEGDEIQEDVLDEMVSVYF